MMRKLTYAQAINEALIQEMDRDPRIFVYGIGVPDHKCVFGTTNELVERFPGRCIDTPLSEDTMTGFGIGAALGGLRPIHIHIRADFALLAMNQFVNMLSSHRYITGQSVPLVVRIIVGRGWGQGCHHSKSLHSFFTHIPGLKVLLPSRPHDAKGLLVSAIRDDDPVVVIEHRWLYWVEGEVPEESYETPYTAQILREGRHVSIIATSWLTVEALHAARIMERRGIEVEVVDPRSARPLDAEMIVASAAKTRRIVVADNDWLHSGFGAEIVAQIVEAGVEAEIRRVGFAPSPCPTVRHLETVFYPGAERIIRILEQMLDLEPADLSDEDFYAHENRFKGPF